MIKRIQAIMLVLLLLCGNVFAISSESNYTSSYFSDTSNLEEVKLIDQLYEYGLISGIINPTENRLGVFGPNDLVTY